MRIDRSHTSGPMLHGDDRFAVIFEFEGRERESGREINMKELGVHHVAGGKIVREEFYYAA